MTKVKQYDIKKAKPLLIHDGNEFKYKFRKNKPCAKTIQQINKNCKNVIQEDILYDLNNLFYIKESQEKEDLNTLITSTQNSHKTNENSIQANIETLSLDDNSSILKRNEIRKLFLKNLLININLQNEKSNEKVKNQKINVLETENQSNKLRENKNILGKRSIEKNSLP